MPIKLVGKESFFQGKSLYEIARNLKNLGEGRYVVRKAFRRYEEPSFYKLTSVRMEMNAKGYNKGTAYGQRVFRGTDFGVCKIETGHKFDWVLIPKDQEQELLDSIKDVKPRKQTIIPEVRNLPPLMEIILRQELTAEGFDVKDDMFYYRNKIKKAGKYNTAVLASDSYQQVRLEKSQGD